MIFKARNPRDIKKGKHEEKGKAFGKFTIVKGELIINEQQREKMQMVRALQTLQRNDYSIFSEGDRDELSQANNVLHTLDCSVVNHGRSFSLMSVQTDEEVISNPNISNLKDLKRKKNKQVKTTAAFPNYDDPFYEFDDRPPRYMELQNEDTKKQEKRQQKIQLAAGLSKMNLVSKRPLKYFMK